MAASKENFQNQEHLAIRDSKMYIQGLMVHIQAPLAPTQVHRALILAMPVEIQDIQ